MREKKAKVIFEFSDFEGNGHTEYFECLRKSERFPTNELGRNSDVMENRNVRDLIRIHWPW